MNTLTTVTGRELTPAEKAEQLKAIESRIEVSLCSAYEKIVEVGRCLIAAKDQKLVPHGEWEAWLNRVCGMNERQAQRWMQIAREVPEGTYLSRLGISKMRMVLALPEAEREPIAKKAVEEGLDVKALKKEIALQRERAEAAEAKQKDLAAFAQREDRRVKELEQRLNEALNATRETGISAEAAKQIEDLKRKLTDAQTLARVQSEKRQAAQAELVAIKQAQSAKQSPDGAKLEAAEFLSAARQFIQVAGLVPHMGRAFAGMGETEKRAWREGVEMLCTWARAAERALDTVEGTVEA